MIAGSIPNYTKGTCGFSSICCGKWGISTSPAVVAWIAIVCFPAIATVASPSRPIVPSAGTSHASTRVAMKVRTKTFAHRDRTTSGKHGILCGDQLLTASPVGLVQDSVDPSTCARNVCAGGLAQARRSKRRVKDKHRCPAMLLERPNVPFSMTTKFHHQMMFLVEASHTRGE